MQNLSRLLKVKLPEDLSEAFTFIDELDVADHIPVVFNHMRLLDYSIPVMALFKQSTAEWDLMDAYFQEDPDAVFITQDELNHSYTGIHLIRRAHIEELEEWFDNMPMKNCVISPGDDKFVTLVTPLYGFFGPG